MAPLLHVPISTGGHLSCSSPADRVYLVEFYSPPDNRLSSAFNEAFLVMLDLIEAKLPKGVLITTSAIEKFYSNGLELSDLGDPGVRSDFFSRSFYPLLARILSFPMPTVALLNGHTFAGGLILAMHHDYRIQNPSKGFLCMNEVLFGAQMDPPLLGIFRSKVTSPATYRSLVLEGHRFAADQALQEGLVDNLGGREEVLQFIKDRDLTKKAESGVFGGLKEEMYREQLALLSSSLSSAEWSAASTARSIKRKSDQDRRIEGWCGKVTGSKL